MPLRERIADFLDLPNSDWFTIAVSLGIVALCVGGIAIGLARVL